ncbi:hypothetical protein EGW03_04895 [bacterium]|nr:hypothetical protein [bacterium]
MIYITSLGYSFHIGSDKNKKNSSKASAKSNLSGTTSKSNNAIQNAAGLSKCDNHNCRKYDDKEYDVEIIRGTNSIVNDVKKLYKDEFEDARLEYNSRQVREDRKIKDYFTHVSNNTKSDLACEIIIELGDMEFWGTKDITYKKKMTNVFEEQVKSLEELVPNFKIASAIIHYDEKSPHLHIIGVPIKYQNKYGMKKQVGKSSVFTKESLTKIQDKIRLLSIESFNKEYQTNYKLKQKLKGRNKDYHITEMDNYQQMKDNIEIHQRYLKLIEEKNNDLSNKTKEIEAILDNLKSKGFVKSELVLKVVDRDKMIAFINLVNKTIIEYQSVAELTATLKELESELLSNRDRLKLLEKNNEDLSLNVDSLTKSIKEKDEEISELKKENLNLKSFLKKLKDKFYFIKHFIFTKLIDHKEKDKYVQLTHDLYEHRGLDEDDYKELINFSKPINSSRDYIAKEKDDYER